METECRRDSPVEESWAKSCLVADLLILGEGIYDTLDATPGSEATAQSSQGIEDSWASLGRTTGCVDQRVAVVILPATVLALHGFDAVILATSPTAPEVPLPPYPGTNSYAPLRAQGPLQQLG